MAVTHEASSLACLCARVAYSRWSYGSPRWYITNQHSAKGPDCLEAQHESFQGHI